MVKKTLQQIKRETLKDLDTKIKLTASMPLKEFLQSQKDLVKECGKIDLLEQLEKEKEKIEYESKLKIISNKDFTCDCCHRKLEKLKGQIIEYYHCTNCKRWYMLQSITEHDWYLQLIKLRRNLQKPKKEDIKLQGNSNKKFIYLKDKIVGEVEINLDKINLFSNVKGISMNIEQLEQLIQQIKENCFKTT